MKIITWNVAGMRAQLKKPNIFDLLETYDPDIICFQETKCNECEVKINEEIKLKYPWMFWNSTKGTTQRKGLSGTAIWSKHKPIAQIAPPESDEEGRITAIEFENFIIMTTYTPNSQNIESDRLKYRTEYWHNNFKNYISLLKNLKPTIICGDFNVAHTSIDVHSPEKHTNHAGFLQIEREQFTEYLELGFIDETRKYYPTQDNIYTYWNNLNPKIRQNNRGWRIDYFITSKINSSNCEVLHNIYGSDHCPILLEI